MNNTVLLTRLVDSCDDAIIGKTIDGRITSWNRAAERMYGYTVQEVLGKHISILAPPDQRDELVGILARLKRGEAIRNYETVRVRKDGRAIRVSLTISPIRSPHGVIGASAVAREIPENGASDRVNQALRHLAAIIESSEDAIISKNLRGTIQSWNPAAERIFGYTAAEAIGQSITMLIPPERMDEEPMILARIRRGERIERYETVRVRKDGEPIHVSVTVSPIRDRAGNVIGASKIARDISERTQNHEELARYRERLEELVIERTEELRASLEQLRRSERLASLGTLAAGIAHEINNPLNAILLTAEYARSSTDPAEVQSAYQTIMEHAKRGGRIVRGILDFAREVKTPRAPGDLNNVVYHAAGLAGPYLNSANLALKLELADYLPPIAMNATELEQVVVNLLKNAAEACPTHASVVIRTERRGQDVLLTVSDNGPGIPESHLARIFDPFFSTRQGRGGTGLGLSICYRIIADHGGSITVQSQPRKGTTFRIVLPIAASVPADSPAPVPA